MVINLLLPFLFWTSLLALIYSYIIYPAILAFLARGKQIATQQYDNPVQYPQVSVLMAVHNEAAVIKEKLNSLVRQEFPNGKLNIYIGSDNSSDQTNEIIDTFVQKYPHLHFFPFFQRQGKPGVINQLAATAISHHPAGQDHVFVITDASVMLTENVCAKLVKHFKHPDLAIVDAQMLHTGMQDIDISGSENRYISWEGRLKYYESVLWMKMIGPFGGCYALRSDYFIDVPDNFLVDDFYITLQVFQRGGLAIKEPEAVCYEPVGHELDEEFRRKARISAGNLQNMFSFPSLWLPPIGLPNFPFFSHKILRWLGPIWLILLWITSGLLYHNQFYALAFVLLTALYLLTPLVDQGLKQLNIHWALLRNVRYFLTMNLALLAGYLRYVKGIKSNVWQPPKRE